MVDRTKELFVIIEALMERERVNGCINCAYIECKEWEMPCCKCRRGCKDYWRRAEVEE